MRTVKGDMNCENGQTKLCTNKPAPYNTLLASEHHYQLGHLHLSALDYSMILISLISSEKKSWDIRAPASLMTILYFPIVFRASFCHVDTTCSNKTCPVMMTLPCNVLLRKCLGINSPVWSHTSAMTNSTPMSSLAKFGHAWASLTR